MCINYIDGAGRNNPRSGEHTMNNVKLQSKMFRWYPALAANWSGVLSVVGEYGKGQTSGEVIVKNDSGETMAVRAQHIDAA